MAKNLVKHEIFEDIINRVAPRSMCMGPEEAQMDPKDFIQTEFDMNSGDNKPISETES